MSTPDEPTPVHLVAVCHTDGCPAQDTPSPGCYYPYGDFDPPRYMGVCGRCGQQITDLTPAPAPTDTPPAEDPPPVLSDPVEPTGP